MNQHRHRDSAPLLTMLSPMRAPTHEHGRPIAQKHRRARARKGPQPWAAAVWRGGAGPGAHRVKSRRSSGPDRRAWR
eukprot:1017411-Alexandrium_andersonii.AAC.1